MRRLLLSTGSAFFAVRFNQKLPVSERLRVYAFVYVCHAQARDIWRRRSIERLLRLCRLLRRSGSYAGMLRMPRPRREYVVYWREMSMMSFMNTMKQHMRRLHKSRPSL